MSKTKIDYTPLELLSYMIEKFEAKKCKTKSTAFTLQDIYQYIYRKRLPSQCGGNVLICNKRGAQWLIEISDEIAKDGRGEIGKANLKNTNVSKSK